MIDRRMFMAGLGAALAVPLTAEAQQGGKTFHIGVVSSGDPVPTPGGIRCHRISGKAKWKVAP